MNSPILNSDSSVSMLEEPLSKSVIALDEQPSLSQANIRDSSRNEDINESQGSEKTFTSTPPQNQSPEIPKRSTIDGVASRLSLSAPLRSINTHRPTSSKTSVEELPVTPLDAVDKLAPGRTDTEGTKEDAPASPKVNNEKDTTPAAAPSPIKPRTGGRLPDHQVDAIMEINGELMRVYNEFHSQNQTQLLSAEFHQYFIRIQSNMHWLAQRSDQFAAQIPQSQRIHLPILSAPPVVPFTPCDRLQAVYATLPSLFERESTREQNKCQKLDELDLDDILNSADMVKQIETLVDQGRSYLEQGLDGSAEDCWKRVLDYQERTLGPQHPELEEAIYSLAETSSHMGAYDETISYLNRVVELRKRSLGDSHQDTIQARFLSGMALFKQDKFSEAELCWKEVQKQVINSKVHADICLTMHWLGMAFHQQEKFDEAEKIWLDEVHARQEWRDSPPSEIQVALRWLGEACLKQDKLSDAKFWWGKELDGWVELQEDIGMEIPDAMYRLGCACYEHGELKEAEEWWGKQVAYLDDLDADYPHASILETLARLGKVAFQQQRYSKAIYWWRREVDGRTTMFGLAAAESVEALFWLGRAYFEGRKLAEAEIQWRRAIQVRPDGEGLSGDASTTQILYWLGRVCFERGEYEEAQKYWSEELKIQEKVHERSSRSVLDPMSRVAQASFEGGQKEDAIEMWKEEVELRRESHGEACKETLSAMDSLSHGYSELGHYVDTTEWSEAKGKIRREVYGDEVEQLDGDHQLGCIHFEAGRLEDAERLWGEELEKREKAHPEHRWVARVLYKRSKLYLQTNRFPEAEMDIRRAFKIQSKHPGAKDPTLQECQALLDSINALGSVNDISSSATSVHVEESNQAEYPLDDPPTSYELSSKNKRNIPSQSTGKKEKIASPNTAMSPAPPASINTTSDSTFKWQDALSIADTVLEMGKGVEDVAGPASGPLTAACAILRALIKAAKQWREYEIDLQELVDKLNRQSEFLEKQYQQYNASPFSSENAAESEFYEAFQIYVSDLQAIAHVLDQLLQRDDSGVRRFTKNAATVKSIQGSIDGCVRKLDDFYQRFTVSIRQSNQVQLDEIHAFQILNTLLIANPKQSYQECLNETCTATLQEIRNWAVDSRSKPMFALVDHAGTGKSTIATNMMAEWENNRLYTRFCFTKPSIITAEKLASSLSRSLADRSLRVRQQIIASVQSHSDFGRDSIPKQLELLVFSPLRLERRALTEALEAVREEKKWKEGMESWVKRPRYMMDADDVRGAITAYLDALKKVRVVGRSDAIMKELEETYVRYLDAQEKALLETLDQPPILVIDALDECSIDDRKVVLDSILQALSIPPTFKVLLTCRPESDIYDRIKERVDVVCQSIDFLLVQECHPNQEIDALIKQGRSYLEQGFDGSAEACWRRVLDYQERELGPQHPELEEAIYSLAETSSRMGAYDETISYLNRVVELRKRSLGDSHQYTIQARFLRGMALFKQDKFSEAEICWKEIQGQVINDQVDDNICLTMHWLGMALYRQEEFDEAEKMWTDEVHVRQEWRDGPLSETLVAMRWLGEACLKQDKLSNAKVWWEKELDGWKLLQEDAGMEIPDVMYRLGCACHDQGELKEAEGWWEKQVTYLDDLDAHYPHSSALETLARLGEVAFQQQRYAKAIRWWRREVDGRVAMFGLAGAESVQALFWLGRAYFEGGQLIEAQMQWRRAIQAQPDEKGLSGNASAIQILYWLGRVCFDRGEYEEAHKHWSQELKIQERMHERGSRSVLDTMSRVARACFERGWKENAVEIMKEEVELRRECHGDACEETLSAMESLSSGYCELGRYVEATEWCETTMKVRREIHGSDRVEQLDNLHLMGRIHFKEGRLKDAERIWGEELKKREEVHPEHRRVVRVLYKRSKLYLQTNRVSEAEVDIRRALEIQSKHPGAKDPTLQECQALLHSIGGLDPSDNTTHVEESNQVTGYLDASTSSSKNVENPSTLLSNPSLSASSTAMTSQTPSDSLLVETGFNPSLALQPPLPSVRRFQELGELIASGIIFLISMCAFILSLFGYWMFS